MTDDSISVVGGVSSRTGEPFVTVEWGDKTGQLPPDAARALAADLIESASEAANDAALFEWATKEMKLDVAAAAQMIDAIRQHRRDRWGQPHDELGLPDD